MNEVMIETAEIKSTDKVLDAGCGVGGSSIFMANKIGCNVTGISLSEKQIVQATAMQKRKNCWIKFIFKKWIIAAQIFQMQVLMWFGVVKAFAMPMIKSCSLKSLIVY
jgi:cyclopropane fatty-acyl-phospholipid synthase-like methyltransferase